jgi:hypothetical protein
MPTYYLGTPVPSGNPGQSSWIDTATLPSGAKYNAWDVVFPNFGFTIPGSDTALQAFPYTLTIPAGVIAIGDTVNWRFSINVDGGDPLGLGGLYVWGLRIGGAQYLSPTPGGVSPGDSRPLYAAGGLEGVIKAIGNPADLYLTGAVENVGSFQAVEILIQNLNIAGPVTVEILWQWQAGADPTATAGLYSLGFEITGGVP